MNNELCPICGAAFKVVPAGISKKTGKPYNSFIACSTMGCKGKPGGVGIAAPIPQNNIAQAQERKENSIANAQDRKERAIRVEGAKSSAGRIVAAMIKAGDVASQDWEIKYKEVAEFIFNYSPEKPPFN